MTGVWEGTSVSRSNDPTHWCDTELLFSLTSDTKGSVFGRGVSLWRHRSISFEIVGQFDLAAMEVQLRKRHTGMYTNTVSYEGTIVETCGAAGAPVVQISGTYASGEFALTRVRGAGVDGDRRTSGRAGEWVAHQALVGKLASLTHDCPLSRSCGRRPGGAIGAA